VKVLGLSFGRKNGNCDIVLKQALLGAKKTGADVEYINTCNLKIDRCTGCGACDKLREKGGMSLCTIKDDFLFVENAIMEADALIVAAPVYVLAPVGQFKNLCDRIGPSHDRGALMRENNRRKDLGWSQDRMIDAKYFKDRPLGLISVGGARTESWTSMGVSGMHLIGFSNQMIPVDAINAYGMGDRVNPAFDQKFMDRLKKLGEHIGSAAGKSRKEIKWMGDEEGICPVCHCDQLTVRKGTTVECTVCGCVGTLKVIDEQITVDYAPEQLERSRYHIGGVIEHSLEIADMMSKVMDKIKKDGDKIPDLLAEQKIIPELKKTV
jgi:multimeric flavodoxin WrbA